MRGFGKKKSIINIADEDLKDAKLSVADFQDEATKKRAFVDVLGARLAMKLFFSQKIEANNLYSLYTIHNVLEELDIADIYYNNVRIDVRLIFNKDEIFIPRAQFEYKLLPDLYSVLLLNEDMSSVEFLGFFEPKDIERKNSNELFYFFDAENLKNPDELKKFLNDFSPASVDNHLECSVDKAKELFISLIDKDISIKDKTFLFKQLAKSIELREKMVEFENFETISNGTVKNEEVLDDAFFDIIGAQQVNPVDSSSTDISDEDLSALLSEADDFLGEKSESAENQEKEKSTVNNLNLPPIIAGAGIVAAGLPGAAASLPVQDIVGGAAGAIGNSLNGSTANEINHIEKTQSNASGVGDDSKTEDLSAVSGQLNAPISESESMANLEELISVDEAIEEEAEMEEGLKNFLSKVGVENCELEKTLASENSPSMEFQNAEVLDDNEDQDLEVLDNFESSAVDAGTEDEEDAQNETVGVENFAEAPIQEVKSEAEDDQLLVLPEIDNPELYEEDVSFDENGELISIDQNNDSVIESVIAENEDSNSESLSFESDLDENIVLDESENEDFSDENLVSLENFEQEISQVETEKEVEGDGKAEDFEEDESLANNEISEEENLANDETPKETTEDDIIKWSNELEAMEDEGSEVENNKPEQVVNDSDSVLISEIDDFITDIEKSPEHKKLLEDALDEEVVSSENEKEPEDEIVFYQKPEDDFVEVSPADKKESKDLLTALFQKEQLTEAESIESGIPKMKFELTQRNKMIIAASVATVVLATAIVGGNIIGGHKNDNANLAQNTNIQAPENQSSGDMNQNGDINQDVGNQMPQSEDPQGSMNGMPQQGPGMTKDMGQSVSGAFSSEPLTANVTKVAWEVPEDVAYNDSFRHYLQIAGKNLKLNLQNNLLLANDMAYSNKVIVELNINKDGSLQGSNITVSSGSKQIDKIVLQSVKETLKYLKMPADELSGKSLSATLIINF